jgi:2-polyprenylphenol 6-hydroxylase
MKSSYDIVIVGGGIVGSALACALGGGPFKVALVDHLPVTEPAADGFDQRVSAFSLASRALFENLGAWPGILRRRAAPVEAMQVWDENGSGSIRFDAAEMAEPCLAYIIENNAVRAALVERLHQFTNIHHLCPVDVAAVAVEEQQSVVTLKDGRVLGARLVVGADGAESSVREAAGIARYRHVLAQTGIVATVTTEKPHQSTARQRFLTTGPLAFLPLPEAGTCSIVWSADTARADALMTLDDTAFRTELQSAFGDSLGALTSVGPRAAFPLALSLAQRYTAPRLALVGDAAHTVHPLAGLGVNIGLLDVAALAEVLRDGAARQRDIGAHALLRRYERWRKGDNALVVSTTGLFRYVFSNDLPLLAPLRNLALDVANGFAPLKNLVMRRASGLIGDLPPLAHRPPA